MSDTPRTDAAEYESQDEPIKKLGAVDVEFSRTLERELNSANQIIHQQQLLDEENLRLQERIKRLDEWKESALEVEREWDANAVATMLGAKLGESQRKVIQREVPLLLERIKRLEEALSPFAQIGDIANDHDSTLWLRRVTARSVRFARFVLEAKEAKL